MNMVGFKLQFQYITPSLERIAGFAHFHFLILPVI